MRATAVILVVLFHAGLPVRGGFVGVDVFFVISGFVITGMLARELNAAGCIDMRRFYARRVRRILPALALVVVVVVVCAALILSPIGAQQQVAQTGTLAMPMLANVGMINADDGYFARSAEGNALLHIWSLGVEEQFYLAFPAILAMGVWVGARALRLTRTSSMVGAVTLVLLGSLALCIALTQGLRIIRAIPAPDATAFYSSPARAWEFAAGALVALLDERIGRLPARLLATLGWCGVAVLVWSSVVLTGDGFPGYRALPPVLAAAALIVAGTDPRRSGLVVRGLAARWMTWIGDRSYSWYLWHWPCIVIAAALWPGLPLAAFLAAGLSLIMASLSFTFIEEPIRNNRELGGRRLVAFTLALLVVPTGLALVLRQGARVQWNDTAKQQMAAQLAADHVDHVRGCDANPWPKNACTWDEFPGNSPIYLVGDSLAGALSEGMIGAAAEQNRPLAIRTSSGCFFAGRDHQPTQRITKCGSRFAATLTWLADVPLGDVVISTSDTYVFRTDLPMGLAGLTSPEDKRRLYLDGLDKSIAGITDLGHHVVVIGTTPGRYPTESGEMAGFEPARCAGGLLFSVDRCAHAIRLTRIKRAIQAASREVVLKNGAQFLDLTDKVCDGDSCPVRRGEVWIYRDSVHLTTAASSTLTPLLARAIAGGSQKAGG